MRNELWRGGTLGTGDMCKAHYYLIMFELQSPRRLALMCDVLEEGATGEQQGYFKQGGFFFFPFSFTLKKQKKL